MRLFSRTRTLWSFAIPASILFMALGQSCIAQEWLHAIDDTTPFTKLTRLDTNALVFHSPQGEIKLLKDQLIRFGRQAVPLHKPILLLTDGSWIAGQPVEIGNSVITWSTSHWGILELPRTIVRGLVLQPPGSPRAWHAVHHRLQSSSAKAETGPSLEPELDYVLTDQGWISGVLQPPTNTSAMFNAQTSQANVLLERSSRNLSIAWESIVAVQFSTALTPWQPTQMGMIRFGLEDGSLIRCQSWHRKADETLEFELTLPVKLTTEGNSQALIQTICFADATRPTARMLSTEKPASYRHLATLGREFLLGQNLSIYGEPLTIQGRMVDNGLAMPSASQVAYRLDASKQMLRGQLAWLDPVAETSRIFGSVRCKVLFSRGGPLEEALDIPLGPTVPWQEPSLEVKVDLTGCRLVVLLVESDTEGDVGDQVAWLDARITP